MQIPLSAPDINDADRAAVLEVLNSGALSLGPKLPEFEQAVTRVTKSRYAVAVNSGTSALHLCVKAAGITDEDEVITSPFSFIASANCILFERAKPVFVDIDPITYNIDVSKIEDAITPRTKAILPVHVFGRPCNLADVLTSPQTQSHDYRRCLRSHRRELSRRSGRHLRDKPESSPSIRISNSRPARAE